MHSLELAQGRFAGGGGVENPQQAAGPGPYARLRADLERQLAAWVLLVDGPSDPGPLIDGW